MGNNLVRLSQCMIVKNEEHNIERALTWGRDIMFEQIVVDTGSSDRTVQIAEDLGAKVFHFEWTNDFSAAKNYAIDQAKGNWIAFLDADEYYEAGDARKLMDILKKFEVGRKKYGCPDIIRSSLANLNKDRSIKDIIMQDRIFQNKKYIRYTGRIHEYLARTDGKGLPSQYDAHKELTILHTGYAEDIIEQKQERNEAMLLEELKASPEDYQVWYYLGQCYMVQKDWRRAGEVFDKCISNINKIPDAAKKEDALFSKMRTLIWENDFNKEPEMQQIYQLALRMFPDHPDADYLMGSWKLRQNLHRETITYLEQALKKLEHYDSSYSNVDMKGNLAIVYRNLAASYREVGNLNDFVRNAVFALRLEPYTDVLLAALLDSLKGDGGQMTVQSTLEFLGKLYDLQNPKSLLFVIKCAKMAAFEELAEKVYNLPQTPRD